MSVNKPFSRWRPHPWHGLDVGPEPPGMVTAYIEITPFDSVKYELDKGTGYIRVDRPQRSSAQPPSLYGFIPQTYCGSRVAALSSAEVEEADHDPLDICVLSERPVNRSDIIMNARVVGGLQMIDEGEADDKIIAVLENDLIWGDSVELDSIADIYVERLMHYFSTYKLVPGKPSAVTVTHTYNRAHAEKVILAAMADYQETFGGGQLTD
jgi:inorganic pyrophosphatase